MDDTVSIGPPHMSAAETQLFETAVNRSHRYLEFGMGGSSLVAVRSGLDAIVSVDSDPKWVASVKQHPEVARRAANGSMSVLHGDIGPVREWGNPVDRSHVGQWPRYIGAAWAEWSRRGQLPDLVLVDGRFRVACCLSVVLATHGTRADELPSVLIHDFNDERPQYRELLDWFDVKAHVEALCHLEIKPQASVTRALVRFLEVQFDFG